MHKKTSLALLDLVIVFNLCSCSEPERIDHRPSRMQASEMKPITYRGGIVRFAIPKHWIEEYEPEGGGTFYEDRPDSGTLRLNVLSFDGPTKTAEEIALTAFRDTESKLLPSGFRVRHYVDSATEQGESLQIYRWDVAVPVPPNRLRLVCFTYTIQSGQQQDARIAAELSMINDSVSSASYSQEMGVPRSLPE